MILKLQGIFICWFFLKQMTFSHISEGTTPETLLPPGKKKKKKNHSYSKGSLFAFDPTAVSEKNSIRGVDCLSIPTRLTSACRPLAHTVTLI